MQLTIALLVALDFKKCLIVFDKINTVSTSKVTSFVQSNEKTFIPSVTGQKHQDLNLQVLFFLFDETLSFVFFFSLIEKQPFADVLQNKCS